MNRLRGVFNEYATASNKMAAAQFNPEALDQMWNDYQQEMIKQPFTDESASPRQRSEVIRQLRQRGVHVPDGWRLNDRRTFEDSAGGGGLQTFRTGANAALGGSTTIQPGLQWAQFIRHQDVTRYVEAKLAAAYPAVDRGSIAMKEPAPPIVLDADPADFETRVYQPQVADQIRRAVWRVKQPASSYAAEGTNHELGLKSMRAVVVAPLALFFSLFFGLTNLASLAATLVPGPTWVRWGTSSALLAALFIAPLLLSNSMSEAPVYKTLASQLESRSATAAIALKWLIHAQPVFYPVGRIAQSACIGVLNVVGVKVPGSAPGSL